MTAATNVSHEATMSAFRVSTMREKNRRSFHTPARALFSTPLEDRSPPAAKATLNAALEARDAHLSPSDRMNNKNAISTGHAFLESAFD